MHVEGFQNPTFSYDNGATCKAVMLWFHGSVLAISKPLSSTRFGEGCRLLSLVHALMFGTIV